jgi:hypothetical protein
MQNLTLEEVGDSSQADVRMGPDVDPFAGFEPGRSEVIEEHEGANRPDVRGW